MVASTPVDLVKVYATNTGAGALVLGTALAGFRGVEALIDGATYSYSVQQGSNFELGTGVYSVSGVTLTRGVITSSYGNTAVPLSPNAVVTFTTLAKDLIPIPGTPGAPGEDGEPGPIGNPGPTGPASPQSFVIAASDETTALTAGVGKVSFRIPYPFTITGVRASLTTAQASGNILTVDINDAGVSILSTKLTIDNTETTSITAATPAVISDNALADDDLITVDIDQIGNGTATGLKVVLIGTTP